MADILVIDDDKDIVDTMRIILESRGYLVRYAYNGKNGYAELTKKAPDVIILDVMMSTETEGFDLACKLQESPEYKRIPILMLTSFPQKMTEEGPEKFQHILGEDWPVTRFFEKPIKPEKLISAIEEVLGSR
ncbi:MAG: response regulator [Desulfobacteraceae bacterium]|nr:MAG: response regulator [Desulfobacteraceae bacterium]